MFGLENVTGTAQAAATVGLVLAEAIVLYIGYGAVSSVAGAAVLDLIGGD